MFVLQMYIFIYLYLYLYPYIFFQLHTICILYSIPDQQTIFFISQIQVFKHFQYRSGISVSNLVKNATHVGEQTEERSSKGKLEQDSGGGVCEGGFRGGCCIRCGFRGYVWSYKLEDKSLLFIRSKISLFLFLISDVKWAISFSKYIS